MASYALTATRRDEDAELWELRVSPRRKNAPRRARGRTREADACAPRRDECREKPKNLPLRLSLGDLLMERGDPRGALDVYRAAVRMKPSYSKANRKVAEAEAACAELAPEEEPTDDGGGGAADADPAARASAEAARLKARGNACFNNGCYVDAWENYSDAIDCLAAAGVAGRAEDAKLHTNRAACLLTADRWVPAAHDGARAISLDAEWWKGYWYRGQALLGQLKGKRPSKVMQQKAEVALKALERASQCTGFPEDKRERVEQLQARARNIVFYLAQNQCPTQ